MFRSPVQHIDFSHAPVKSSSENDSAGRLWVAARDGWGRGKGSCREPVPALRVKGNFCRLAGRNLPDNSRRGCRAVYADCGKRNLLSATAERYPLAITQETHNAYLDVGVVWDVRRRSDAPYHRRTRWQMARTVAYGERMPPAVHLPPVGGEHERSIPGPAQSSLAIGGVMQDAGIRPASFFARNAAH